MSPGTAPRLEGFRLIRGGGATVLAREEAVAWVENALADAGELHPVAAATPDAVSLRGRGAVYVIPASSAAAAAEPSNALSAPGASGERWVVRHYYRGGMMAPILGDRYARIGRPRAWRETEASEVLRARGFRTPRVVAAAVYTAGAFVRGDLVTEFVPDAAELAEVLFPEAAGAAHPDPDGITHPERIASLCSAGALVGSLGAAGIFHPDLNAKNILLQRREDAGPRAHLIDLDRCDVSAARRSGESRGSGESGGSRGSGESRGAGETAGSSDSSRSGESGESPGSRHFRGSDSPSTRRGSQRFRSDIGARMYRRLYRSLRKWESSTGEILSEAEWSALARSFRETRGPRE